MEASDVESDADEVMVDATAEDDDDDDNSDAESDDSSLSDLDPASGIRFDPDACELVLPNGRRLGHRSLQRYYNQRPTFREAPEPGPGRRSITDKTDQALIARRGGFGDFGEGGEVIRARNKGEAKNATKNPYKAMQKRARFELKIGKMWVLARLCLYCIPLTDALFSLPATTRRSTTATRCFSDCICHFISLLFRCINPFILHASYALCHLHALLVTSTQKKFRNH